MPGKKGGGENTKKAAGNARKAEAAAAKKAAKDQEIERQETEQWKQGSKDTSKAYGIEGDPYLALVLTMILQRRRVSKESGGRSKTRRKGSSTRGRGGVFAIESVKDQGNSQENPRTRSLRPR